MRIKITTIWVAEDQAYWGTFRGPLPLPFSFFPRPFVFFLIIISFVCHVDSFPILILKCRFAFAKLPRVTSYRKSPPPSPFTYPSLPLAVGIVNPLQERPALNQSASLTLVLMVVVVVVLVVVVAATSSR
ncbi:hypothetical protein BGW80DRAFT_469800 [Lactifluus volemus]|nr:hypothetical protein BGW80DRAFT_469800 [Lactifluus volemus]